jgi:hypothetical protein
MRSHLFVFGVAALLCGWTAALGREPRAVPAGCGSLKGTVRFVGDRPDLDAMNAKVQRTMRLRDADYFFSPLVPPEERQQQTWRIGPRGELANVMVWLEPEAGTFFAVDAGHPGVVAARENAVVRMTAQFLPHTQIVMPQYTDAAGKTVRTGQRLRFVNDSHRANNAHYDGDQDNPGGNVLVPPGKDHVWDDPRPSRRPVFVSSSIYPWMTAFVRVLDHPHFAVTGADGTYEIRNAPAGKVRVYAWHEATGYLNAGLRVGEAIELTDGRAVTKDFTARFVP